MYGLDPKNPRLTTLIVQSEGLLPEVSGEIPEDSAARYRDAGLPRVLALAGVVVGFVLAVVPGVLALRSYHRWHEGAIATPRAAWTVLSVASGIGLGVTLWGVSPLLGAVAGLIATAIGLSLSSP
jgi:Kef-type K+ transport system membrane component KefB